VSITDDGAAIMVAFDDEPLQAQISFSRGTYRTGDAYAVTLAAWIGGHPAPYAVLWYALILPDGTQYPGGPIIADANGTVVLAGTITPDLPRGMYTIVLHAAWWNRLDTTQGTVQIQ
jgi:hypothetical protein